MSSFFLDEDIAKFSREHGFLGWGLVSAKEGTGIEEAASRCYSQKRWIRISTEIHRQSDLEKIIFQFLIVTIA